MPTITGNYQQHQEDKIQRSKEEKFLAELDHKRQMQALEILHSKRVLEQTVTEFTATIDGLEREKIFQKFTHDVDKLYDSLARLHQVSHINKPDLYHFTGLEAEKQKLLEFEDSTK